MAGILDDLDLPVVGSRGRVAKQKWETDSRLTVATAEDKADAKAEAKWKAKIWTRDRGECRWCHRNVVKTLTLQPDQGHCHHVSGKVVKAIRWLVKNGLLLCRSCHEKLTGMVNERHLLVPSQTFEIDGVAYADADFPVDFKRVA